MKSIYLTKREFKRLKYFFIDENVPNTEANFFYEKNNDNYLYKIYRFKDKDYLLNKERTISDLINSKDIVSIPELILPEKKVIIDNSFQGILIERIKGCNASILLQDKFISLKTKIEILKQIGVILGKIKNVDKSLNLAFGDVHAGNFMLLNDKVYGIDTDGLNIFNNKGRINYYLLNGSFITDIKKYSLDYNNMIKASTETDLFCYIMMVLEIIFNGKVYKLTLDQFKYYLDYLDKLGFDSNLLKSFASIYDEEKDNISPLPYLDNLTTINTNASFLTLKKKGLL